MSMRRCSSVQPAASAGGHASLVALRQNNGQRTVRFVRKHIGGHCPDRCGPCGPKPQQSTRAAQQGYMGWWQRRARPTRFASASASPTMVRARPCRNQRDAGRLVRPMAQRRSGAAAGQHDLEGTLRKAGAQQSIHPRLNFMSWQTARGLSGMACEQPSRKSASKPRGPRLRPAERLCCRTTSGGFLHHARHGLA
jgi:hypothetical protein